MLKLDLKDKKLLYEIDFDARKSYAELAKTLRMSKRGVEYNLDNLEKKKVILGYAPVINISKLGYLYCRVFVKFQNLTKEIEKEIEEHINKEKNIGWSIRYYGLFDNGFTIWAKNITEFKEIANRFYLKFDRYIKKRIESVGTEIIFCKNRYLLKNKNFEIMTLKEMEEPAELDELDRDILIKISENTRINFVS